MLFACGLGSGRADESALDAIRKAGVIRIGVTGDYLPYSFRDADDRLSGADKDKFTTLEAIDQTTVRVVVNPGGTNERFAREHFHQAQLAVWPDNRTIFERIAEREADVMVTDGVEVTLQAARHPGILCPAGVAEPFTHFDKAYLLRRDPALRQAVDAWMTDAIATGKWRAYLDAAMH